MVRSIPNMITSLRIIGTVLLLFIEPLTLPFYIIYTVSGFSDALDGFIARRFHLTSDFGTHLDSFADLLFYTVMLFRIFPVLWGALPMWIWYCVGAVLLIRVASYITAGIKYHRFATAHTYLNKATGALVFLAPYFVTLPFFLVFCVTVCAVGATASGEELLIHLFAKEYDENTKTILRLSRS